VALASARRRRSGPVSVRSIRLGGSEDSPRVGYAIGRWVGSAVRRNRARRRLRSAVGERAELLDGGCAYLFSADQRVLTMPFAGLVAAVDSLLSASREERQ